MDTASTDLEYPGLYPSRYPPDLLVLPHPGTQQEARCYRFHDFHWCRPCLPWRVKLQPHWLHHPSRCRRCKQFQSMYSPTELIGFTVRGFPTCHDPTSAPWAQNGPSRFSSLLCTRLRSHQLPCSPFHRRARPLLRIGSHWTPDSHFQRFRRFLAQRRCCVPGGRRKRVGSDACWCLQGQPNRLPRTSNPDNSAPSRTSC